MKEQKCKECKQFGSTCWGSSEFVFCWGYSPKSKPTLPEDAAQQRAGKEQHGGE